jgi:hypothetical protein
MTILSVVKDVCTTVGVLIPTSVFSNITGNRTMQEMLTLANEMAQRMAYDTRQDGVRSSGELQAHAAHCQRLALDICDTFDGVYPRCRRVAAAPAAEL